MAYTNKCYDLINSLCLCLCFNVHQPEAKVEIDDEKRAHPEDDGGVCRVAKEHSSQGHTRHVANRAKNSHSQRHSLAYVVNVGVILQNSSDVMYLIQQKTFPQPTSLPGLCSEPQVYPAKQQ